MHKKIILAIVTLIILPVFTWSDTHKADSCLFPDVNTALIAASPGDTIEIPPGSATWSSTLLINKSISLIGAGMDSTTIMNNGSTECVQIELSADEAVRITGIHFKFSTNNTGGHSIYIKGKRNGSFGYTKLRIDHNRFEKGTRAVYASGWVDGVIDHNRFLNCNIGVGITGDDNYSWNRPITAGTAAALFIEDNTFTITNSADREPAQQVYHQEGGRTVIRHNVFDGSAYTSGNSLWIDSHGNQNYYVGNSYDFRGQPLIEVYENVMDCYKSYNLCVIRGGSVLFYNNTMTALNGSPDAFRLQEEEAWSTAHFGSGNLRSVWPAEDQITNSFFWGNTLNGSPITQINPSPSDSIFVIKDRDFFMHAPQGSGGKSQYPTRPGADDLTFSPSELNAYYPYSPFTYPHPMVETVGEDLLPPRKLRLVN